MIAGGIANSAIASEYRAWQNMKARCYKKNDKQYNNYGARGIVVCQKWKNNFGAFLADVGIKPTPSHSIGRIDNDGHYEPGNVEWQTDEQQSNNRRSNRIIAINGVYKTLSQWSKHFGINSFRAKERLNRGWPEHLAFIKKLPRGVSVKLPPSRKKQSNLPQGVFKSKSGLNPYGGQITFARKHYHLGLFKTVKDAKAAYDKKRKEFYAGQITF